MASETKQTTKQRSAGKIIRKLQEQLEDMRDSFEEKCDSFEDQVNDLREIFTGEGIDFEEMGSEEQSQRQSSRDQRRSQRHMTKSGKPDYRFRENLGERAQAAQSQDD